MHIPKWLIAAAGLLFVVLIAVVAFFLGRESAPPPAAPVAVVAPPQEPPSVRDPAPAPEPKTPLAEASGGTMASLVTALTSGTAAPEAPPSTAIVPPSSPAPAAVVDVPQVSAEARARVSAYFTQMDALQSGGPIGDQQAFATTLLQGALSGDFSGIDDLVRAAGDAERRAIAVQPPGECAEYHRMAVALLQESRTMVTALRDGLKRNDTDMLTSMGASAQSMKVRADTLAAAEKALRARFGV